MGEAALVEQRVCPLSTPELIDKIILFCEMLSSTDESKFKFYVYQAIFARRIIESVLEVDGASLTALWARQCGKTETIANVSVGLAVLLPTLAVEFPDDKRLMPYIRGFRVGVYAPIDKQAHLPFKRIRASVTSDAGEALLEDIGISVTTNRADEIGFSNGSSVMCRTASPDAQIEGETHNLVILEETQKLSKEKVTKSIRPMLASTNGTMVMIGTAWHSRGGFHVSIQRNNEIWRRTGKRNHYEFTYEHVIAQKRRAYEEDGNPFHLNYEKFVADELSKSGGEDSEEFKMNFRCLWMESRVIAVKIDIFVRAGMATLERHQSYQGFQIAGLDIAKSDDSSVLTVMDLDIDHPIYNRFALRGGDESKQVYHKKTIIDWVEMQGAFEGGDGQYEQVVRYLSETCVQILIVDATTIGNPVFERLQVLLEGLIRVEPFIFGSSTKHSLYKYYLQELHAGRVLYAAGPSTKTSPEYKRFFQQHEELDKVAVGQYSLCQAPEGEKDDYTDSAALAAWGEKLAGSTRLPEMEVEVSGNRRSVSSAHGRAGRYLRR